MLYLATTTPFNNMMKNFDAISESYTCIKDTSKRGIEAYSGELNEISQRINEFSDAINKRIDKVRERYRQIMEVVKQAKRILEILTLKCSKKIGNPYQRCIDAFNDGQKKCRKKHFGLLCKIVSAFKFLCHITKGHPLQMISPDVIEIIIIGIFASA
ncbi:hypothetical protein LSH36_196g09000 [Paralvinella palmiformis]|uniref:Uncharacterized protein n=1 Tax=Paralvinella palmiformis TaxID=53620 RepID=A0AAD9JQQ6_9ANNE|nr:hypothetical protein LSH36_196g09000 [Paralvinella palmiformis]